MKKYWFIYIIMTFMLFACSPKEVSEDTKSYELASKHENRFGFDDTIEMYESFIINYPDSPHTKLVSERLGSKKKLNFNFKQLNWLKKTRTKIVLQDIDIRYNKKISFSDFDINNPMTDSLIHVAYQNLVSAYETERDVLASYKRDETKLIATFNQAVKDIYKTKSKSGYVIPYSDILIMSKEGVSNYKWNLDREKASLKIEGMAELSSLANNNKREAEIDNELRYIKEIVRKKERFNSDKYKLDKDLSKLLESSKVAWDELETQELYIKERLRLKYQP